MSGKVEFTTGQRVSATDMNNLAVGKVDIFASATARDAAYPSGARATTGKLAITTDNGHLKYWDGDSWEFVVVSGT